MIRRYENLRVKQLAKYLVDNSQKEIILKVLETIKNKRDRMEVVLELSTLLSDKKYLTNNGKPDDEVISYITKQIATKQKKLLKSNKKADRVTLKKLENKLVNFLNAVNRITNGVKTD